MALKRQFAMLIDSYQFAPTTYVLATTQQSVRLNTQARTSGPSGSKFAKNVTVFSQAPDVEFTTEDILTALTVMGIEGMCIDTISGSDVGVEVYQSELSACGNPAASGHSKYLFTRGLVLPRTLQCDHQGDFRLTGVLMAVSADGSTAPVTASYAATLPTIPDPVQYTLGPVSIGGLTVEDIASLSIDFGINVQRVGVDSDVYDKYLNAGQIAPKITIRGLDPELLDAVKIPLTGKVATHANTTIYLRKRVDMTAGFVPDGTAEHIKLTAYGAAFVETPFDAQDAGSGEMTLVLQCADDGTNDPIELNLASAIT